MRRVLIKDEIKQKAASCGKALVYDRRNCRTVHKEVNLFVALLFGGCLDMVKK